MQAHLSQLWIKALKTRRLGPQGVRTYFRALGVEVTIKRIHSGLKHEAAVGAAFKVTFDLDFYDRGQTPF